MTVREGIACADCQSDVLPPGDARRGPLGRAVLATLSTAAAFIIFAYVAKEIPPLSRHAPWQDDPYDAVVSSTIFFTPLLAAVLVLRGSLCRRDQPLPIHRFQDVARTCRAALGAIGITLLADWISVALGPNVAQWDTATRGLVAGLTLVTVGCGITLVALQRAMAQRLPTSIPAASPPDGLADSVAALEQFARGLGPAARVAGVVVRWTDRYAASTSRRHPFIATAALAVLFGVLLSGSQTIGEHIHKVSLILLFFVVGASGMFAFLAAIGSYLRLVRPTHPARGMTRRAIDAAVVACASLALAGGFRGQLHWLIAPLSHGIHGLVAQLVVIAVAVFAATFACETFMGAHTLA